MTQSATPPMWKHSVATMLRKYFVTGLLILVPLAITLWVLNLIIGTMDQSLLLLPNAWQPDTLLRHVLPGSWFGDKPEHFRIPGTGTILTLLIILLTGLATRNFVGNRVVQWWEKIVVRIPVFNSIYSSVKQVSDTLLSPSGNAFRKAVLVEYPRRGCWTIAFLTGAPGGDVKNHLHGDFVSLYVPTTPNPTSGFFLMVPREDITELDMNVDAALKYIVSMGVVAPDHVGKRIIVGNDLPG